VILKMQNTCFLEGRYVFFPGVNPKRIQITYTLFDKENKNPVGKYTFSLKKDGSFRIAIKDRGEFYLIKTGESYPATGPFYTIVYSDEMRPYFYKFEENSTIKLEDIYVSKLIEIDLPKENEKYDDSNELTFKWRSVPFADFYVINVVKLLDNGDKELVLYSKIDSNNASYKELKGSKNVSREVSYDNMKITPMFNTVNEPLNKGKYELSILAYKYYDEKKDFWLLSYTDRDKRHYVYIDGD
jgi:hypothetical protein